MAELLDHQIGADFRVRDVSKTFTVVQARDYPFTAMAKKRPVPNSSLIEWPLKTFNAPQNSPLRDATDVQSGELQNNQSNKTMLKGRIQWARRAVKVGKIAQTLGNQYPEGGGKTNNYAENLADALVELKGDMEYICLGSQESDEQTGTSGTAYATRGLAGWCVASGGSFADTATAPASGYRTAAGAIVDIETADLFTEANIRAMCKAVRDKRKRNGNWKLFCTSTLKQVFSDFTLTGTQSDTALPLRRFNQAGDAGKITLDVQIYVGDFGTVTLIVHDWLYTKIHGLMVDMEMASIGMAQNVQTAKLPNNGGGESGYCDTIFALCCDNPAAHGKVYDAD